mmetsp:Transcript_94551/g.291517  ORF Transcript_94551/g.291517 Transcript_94551/m.291517 type:complete len:378 (-) Transcript_94551:848-1981(-)
MPAVAVRPRRPRCGPLPESERSLAFVPGAFDGFRLASGPPRPLLLGRFWGTATWPLALAFRLAFKPRPVRESSSRSRLSSDGTLSLQLLSASVEESGASCSSCMTTLGSMPKYVPTGAPPDTGVGHGGACPSSNSSSSNANGSRLPREKEPDLNTTLDWSGDGGNIIACRLGSATTMELSCSSPSSWSSTSPGPLSTSEGASSVPAERSPSLATLGVVVPEPGGVGGRPRQGCTSGHGVDSKPPRRSVACFNCGCKFWCKRTARARFVPMSSSFAGVNRTVTCPGCSASILPVNFDGPRPPSLPSASPERPSRAGAGAAPKKEASIVYVSARPKSLATTARPVPRLPLPTRHLQFPGVNSGVSMLRSFGYMRTVKRR